MLTNKTNTCPLNVNIDRQHKGSMGTYLQVFTYISIGLLIEISVYYLNEIDHVDTDIDKTNTQMNVINLCVFNCTLSDIGICSKFTN